MPTLTTLRIQNSTIRIDNNISDKINKWVINLYRKKFRTKSRTLKKSNINRILLQRLSIKNHSKSFFTDKIMHSKTKHLTCIFERLELVKKINMSNPTIILGYITCYSASSCRSIKKLLKYYQMQLSEAQQLIENTRNHTEN